METLKLGVLGVLGYFGYKVLDGSKLGESAEKLGEGLNAAAGAAKDVVEGAVQPIANVYKLVLMKFQGTEYCEFQYPATKTFLDTIEPKLHAAVLEKYEGKPITAITQQQLDSFERIWQLSRENLHLSRGWFSLSDWGNEKVLASGLIASDESRIIVMAGKAEYLTMK